MQLNRQQKEQLYEDGYLVIPGVVPRLMVEEARRCLEEGLAASAEEIDLAMILGTGWAPHRGGPLRYGAGEK